MKQIRTSIVLFFSAVILFSACKKSEDNPITPVAVDESAVLLKYLEENGDYINTSAPSIVSASAVYTNLQTGTQYIIDIRSATDFASGHIQGAHNVTLGDLSAHMKTVPSSYTSVVIACYTGQTSMFATTLLRLQGYSNVSSLKWGMCSWDSVFATGRWLANMKNDRAANFVTDVTAKNAKGNLPALKTGKTTGKEILDARVDQLLKEGFTNTITNATLYTNLSNYYIVNYWPAAQYADPGHIAGAVQYEPKSSLKSTTDLKTLPTDKAVVIYCYTGQTSAAVATYLKLLGYDAKTLLYGANAMIYDRMAAKGMSVFKASEIMRYPYVK
ncbi:MAG: rhodanese-like domain-containing protein [Bacteroidetes bacterium]|nr:rhodanese-like domain-containing protein [Bacteroidota bacterium]